ncbi:MAG: hypothetical protein ACXVBH_05765, partial [Flavisolibacter sp.]
MALLEPISFVIKACIPILLSVLSTHSDNSLTKDLQNLTTSLSNNTDGLPIFADFIMSRQGKVLVAMSGG